MSERYAVIPLWYIKTSDELADIVLSYICKVSKY